MLEIDNLRLPESGTFPPTITLVEGLFDSLGMSLPTPELGIGTSGSVLVLTFKHLPLSATITTRASHEQARRLLEDLPEQIIEVSHPNEIVDTQEYGKIVAKVIKTNEGPFWKMVYDEGEVLRAFQNLLPIDAASTHYNFRLSDKNIPDLIVQFPSNNEHRLLPSIILRDRYDGDWIKTESEAVDRLSRFSHGVLREFKPIWDSWYKIAREELSDKMDTDEPVSFTSLMDSYDTKINLLKALAAL